jgi:hypothetical protein
MSKRNATPAQVGAVTEAAAPQAEGPTVAIPEKVDSWLAQGKTEGTKIRLALEKGELLAVQVLLVYGAFLAKESGSSGDWLMGYSTAFPNANTAKVRKSEAKAVFDAFAMGDTKREIVVGLAKDADGKEIPVKETRSITEWLKAHATLPGRAGYTGLIGLAKALRGPAEGSGAGGGAKRRSLVTVKQQAEIVDSIPLMNSHQASIVVEKASAQLTKLPKFEVAMFKEMSMICNMIKVKSQDKGHLEVASQIIDLLTGHLDRIAADTAKELGATVPAPAVAPVVAPQPAVQAEQLAA